MILHRGPRKDHGYPWSMMHWYTSNQDKDGDHDEITAWEELKCDFYTSHAKEPMQKRL